MCGHRAQILGEPRSLLHVRTLGGERRLLARRGGEAGQLIDRMIEPLAVARGIFEIAARRLERLFGRAPGAVRGGDAGDVEPAEAVEQGAVAARIDQPAIVMLAVDLDQPPAQFAQKSGRGGLVVDEGAAAAVGLDDAADHQRLAGLGLEAVLGDQREGGMIAGQFEACRDHRLGRAVAHQPAIGARAERQAERIEQDRFSRPGLAGQHAQAVAEIQIERLDQDDVTNGQRGEHGTCVEQAAAPRQEARDFLLPGAMVFRAKVGAWGRWRPADVANAKRRRCSMRSLRASGEGCDDRLKFGAAGHPLGEAVRSASTGALLRNGRAKAVMMPTWPSWG